MDFMIAHISGKIVEKFLNSVIVDVNGVGYEIIIPANEFNKVLLNDGVKFYTYHNITERSQELFGFSSLSAKKLFELLITVQGVGPKAGIAIMNLGEANDVRNSIASENIKFIQKASGIGKKTAERVVLELKDKVGGVSNISDTNIDISMGDEALEALVALGYSLSEATKSLEDVPRDLSTEERITIALKKGI